MGEAGRETRDELDEFLSEERVQAPVRAAAPDLLQSVAAPPPKEIAADPPAPPSSKRRPVLKPALAIVGAGLAMWAVVSLVPRARAAEPAVAAAAAPIETHAAAVPVTTVIAPQPPPAESPRATVEEPVARHAAAPPAAETPEKATIDADAVKALWLETDTRSLDRALAAIRRATLALRRCNVEMTAPDQAVARCDVVQGDGGAARRDAAWTIEFRRADDRWQIDSIFAK